MKSKIGVAVILIFAGTTLSFASVSEKNSTSQQFISTDWHDYIPFVGVIGTAIGIYSFLERRKDKARIDRVNEWLDGNANLSELRTKLEKLEGDTRNAQYFMDNALSISIQNVALKERVKMQADLVAKSYTDYKLTVDKIKELPPEAEIPESIKSDVLANLIPEYEKQREKDTLKDRVTVLSISLLIVNSVFANIFGPIFYPF